MENPLTEAPASPLRRTPLHGWHVAHGARMVAFGGWDMPLQYASGITREHIATRTSAGLFDVGHMGRFRVAGPAAQSFLSAVLTNDPRALVPGQAHYTLLANERGAALDDCLLYRLGAQEFLLVVNASNRDKDRQWLSARGVPAGAVLEDRGDELGMLALQGPRAAEILGRVLGDAALPEARRNRVRSGRFGANELIVSRTGYTGEAVCFELFVSPAGLIELWQEMVDAGAQAAGLGARDSLRLEAGLPLYGHEFGLDADGVEIPIFANALARYGVRAPGQGAYVGSAALEGQRAEYDRIVAGTCTTPPGERLLKRLVKPIAVFEGRRPLRAGYRLYAGGEPVGYVTSGTSVALTRAGARPEERPEMRPIGLALVRSDIRYRSDVPVRFEVRGARGETRWANLVERNLPPAARPGKETLHATSRS